MFTDVSASQSGKLLTGIPGMQEAAFLRDELVDLVDVIPEQRLQDA